MTMCVFVLMQIHFIVDFEPSLGNLKYLRSTPQSLCKNPLNEWSHATQKTHSNCQCVATCGIALYNIRGPTLSAVL